MDDQRKQTIVQWATLANQFSGDILDLSDSAASVLKTMDLTSEAMALIDPPFGTEPSEFVRALNELAPHREASKING